MRVKSTDCYLRITWNISNHIHISRLPVKHISSDAVYGYVKGIIGTCVFAEHKLQNVHWGTYGSDFFSFMTMRKLFCFWWNLFI